MRSTRRTRKEKPVPCNVELDPEGFVVDTVADDVDFVVEDVPGVLTVEVLAAWLGEVVMVGLVEVVTVGPGELVMAGPVEPAEVGPVEPAEVVPVEPAEVGLVVRSVLPPVSPSPSLLSSDWY